MDFSYFGVCASFICFSFASFASLHQVPMKPAYLHALLLIAAIFALYRPALDYGFVWDDNLYVVQNPAVQSWDYARAAFTSPETTWSANATYNLPAWRPLRNISYLIDHTVYGLNPIGWHLTNIMLHSAAAVLLLLLLRRLVVLTVESARSVTRQNVEEVPQLTSQASLACLLAAAYWALHPVQTEVVAWVKSRDDLLATPLMFAALLIALPKRKSITQRYKEAKELKKGNARHGEIGAVHKSRSYNSDNPVSLSIQCIFLSSLLFIAALTSKENTIILAALYPIILFIISPRSYAPLHLRIKHLLLNPLILIFPLIALAYLVSHHLILGRTAQAAHPGDTLLQTILTMLHALARYTQLTLWPWPPTTQSADYDHYPIITNALNPGAITGLAILFFLLLLFFVPLCLRVKNAPALRLTQIAAATILITLLPFANIIPMMQILAERFLYLPTAGVAILLSSLLIYFASLRLRVMWFLFFIIILISLAFQTHYRLPTWTNELTLFRDTRLANPTSWRPADLYVKALLKSEETTAALTIANQNMRQFPGDPDIVRTAALAYLLSGHETTGTILTNYAAQLQPNDFRASTTLMRWRRLTE